MLPKLHLFDEHSSSTDCGHLKEDDEENVVITREKKSQNFWNVQIITTFRLKILDFPTS